MNILYFLAMLNKISLVFFYSFCIFESDFRYVSLSYEFFH